MLNFHNTNRQGRTHCQHSVHNNDDHHVGSCDHDAGGDYLDGGGDGVSGDNATQVVIVMV